MSSKDRHRTYRERKKQVRSQEPDTSISVSEAGTRGGRTNKGRAAGTGNGNAKLTEAAVEAIRNREESALALARRYGVHPGQIWRIWRGENWNH